MTNCNDCHFYDVQADNDMRSGEDVAIIGKEPPDNHYCFAFAPIPAGVFEGQKECPKYIKREDE